MVTGIATIGNESANRCMPAVHAAVAPGGWCRDSGFATVSWLALRRGSLAASVGLGWCAGRAIWSLPDGARCPTAACACGWLPRVVMSDAAEEELWLDG